MTEFKHVTDYRRSTDGLNVQPDGVYVDATPGGGGHLNY